MGPARRCSVAVLEAAKPAVVATIVRRIARPTLVLAPRPEQARQWADQLAVWLGQDADVLLFPEPDALPYEPLPSDPLTVQQRMRALVALAAGDPVVVVACGQALMQRTFGAAQLRASIHRLRRGQRVDLNRLLARWVDLGYRAEPLVDLPGTFSRRGGILDIYPPTAEWPVRIELFDDEIESLRAFDPTSQRSTGEVASVLVGPAREGGGDPVAAQQPLQGCLLDHLADSAVAVVDEPEALQAAVEELAEQAADLRAGRIARGELPANAPEPCFLWAELAEHLARPHRIDLRYATFEEVGSRQSAVGSPESAVESRQSAVGSRESRIENRESRVGGVTADCQPPTADCQPPTPDPRPPTRLPFRAAPLYGGRLRVFVDGLPDLLAEAARVVIVSRQSARLAELIEERTGQGGEAGARPAPLSRIEMVHGSLAEGWVLDQPQDGAVVLLTDAEIFGVSKARRVVRRRPVNRDAFLADLSPGDLVVHVEHGIGRFGGLVRRSVGGPEREYLLIEYAADDQLYVPVDQVDRVSRYIGTGSEPPALTRLGSQDWARAKERVRRSVRDIAAELLRLYAARHLAPGHTFSPDTAWQHELEMAFPYVETPDQLTAIEKVKEDMEAQRPMDRLICGDVGYGKTEVALRAAFKAVMDGKQVAVLVPTTVLAQQHYRTFSERLTAFPVVVEMLSRFRSEREQRDVLERLAAGGVDLVVGTHRLIQKDVRFKDLGLVIVDEEQRFGVAHKERLKQLRQEVDVLTLTATPIPRTLQMALAGVRDLSMMETPPEDRLPIKTFVLPTDDRLIREVILREMDRGGQVYFVHNRVYNIESVAHRLRELVPEASIAVGHGQMPEDQLERVMLEFAEGRYDVLICTTIIESGLDIPNVNTIVVNHADTFGLAQLYQLRGRVGRGANRAYAYLLYEKHRALTETAEKRLRAIFEASDLGAGFRIAMKDLEIRGAGNLLGAEQSGHISSVGFELYTRLLGQAVEELRSTRPGPSGRRDQVRRAEPESAVVDLPLAASIPAGYVDDPAARLSLYRRLAEAVTVEAVDDLGRELRDRFGEPPSPARTLLFVATVRVLATQGGVKSVALQDGVVTIQLGRTAENLGWLERSVPGVRVGHSQIRLAQQVAGGEAHPPDAIMHRPAAIRTRTAGGTAAGPTRRPGAAPRAAQSPRTRPRPEPATAPWQAALLAVLQAVAGRQSAVGSQQSAVGSRQSAATQKPAARAARS
ncbi:MAG: transcription-repair coupling factor [Chloroflexi bacterium]|nr:transcription-repair coupling factor [Chloroflexota bacterium]